MLELNTWVNEDCTIGRLRYGEFQCVTLELPWEDNKVDKSCIPAGTYKAKKYTSPSKGPVVLLEDVPGRTWVEIHAGNYTRQILGCILVGKGLMYLDSDTILDVSDSVRTLKALLKALPDEFEVRITRVG